MAVRQAAEAGDPEIKTRVRRFYDSIGWRQIGPGLFQNARFEDLRPVAQEYIQRCHLRVARHLPSHGWALLDAGSGPIQYPAYLEYSRGFRYRVCLDISRLALVEARERLGDHGLYVVGDLSRLPFVRDRFDGVVSLHTVHHLPPQDQRPALLECERVLQLGGSAVIVYSWGGRAPVARITRPAVEIAYALFRLARRGRGTSRGEERSGDTLRSDDPPQPPAGTYVHQHTYAWMKRALLGRSPSKILVWRTPGTAVLRAFIHERFAGRLMLRLLYWLEERAPRAFGWFGQHPMIVFMKPGPTRSGGGN